MHYGMDKMYYEMFVIMIISGILTNMNVYVDKLDDIHLSLNDLYMILLMTGWMFLLMGLLYKENKLIIFGLVLVILNFWFIRNQTFISQKQYLSGMIPHHSMAIHMSKKLLEKENNIKSFLEKIIETQEEEIKIMKTTIQNNENTN
jgi:hypothetical protein